VNPVLFALLSGLIKIVVIIGFLFNVGGLLTWVDRRQSAMIQDRIGPNRAVLKIGSFELRIAGLLHTAADGVKFFFKEDFLPPNADKLLFGLAPILAMLPVLALVAVIPMADTLCLGNLGAAVPRLGVCGVNHGIGPVEMSVAPLNVGLLFIFALAGQGIVAAAIAGVSSDNKFSLLGALRAASQMVSYEVTIGLALVGALMVYGTVRLDEMVRWQQENAWGIFVQPVAFCLYFVAAVAETKRIPFDLPEAESELVSGYFTEYSGMKFGMFYFAEYMEVVTSSMILVTIFLGGWALPFIHRDGITISFGGTVFVQQHLAHGFLELLGVLVFFGKTLFLCFIQAFIRWSLPRFRYDQLMKLGWRVLLPASFVNIFATGIVMGVLIGFDKPVNPGLSSALQLLADLSQAVVAVVITWAVLQLVLGMLKPKLRARWIVGSSATIADAAGGTKSTPMQA
jgi:NADH-quinone oxidoreductase subunit H